MNWMTSPLNKIAQHRKTLSVMLVLIAIFMAAYQWVSHNESQYSKPIAEITSERVVSDLQVSQSIGPKIIHQDLSAVVINGPYKGQKLQLNNSASISQSYGTLYHKGDRVFLTLKVDHKDKLISANIREFKRDQYLLYAIGLFSLLMLGIGGWKGFRSLISVAINIAVFSVVLLLYIKGWQIMLVASAASLFFIVASITLVSGFNKKSLSAILGTLGGTLFAMILAVLTFKLTGSKGVHYEEMEFMTQGSNTIFLAEILIGTLGGIMDIAISIASAVYEMVGENPTIEKSALMKSGKAIGTDIMGTMANTLVFAYMSGSIPMLLLWLKNNVSFSYIISNNLSLEVIRALTGSVGIVASIPITLWISVTLLGNKGKQDMTPKGVKTS